MLRATGLCRVSSLRLSGLYLVYVSVSVGPTVPFPPVETVLCCAKPTLQTGLRASNTCTRTKSTGTRLKATPQHTHIHIHIHSITQ